MHKNWLFLISGWINRWLLPSYTNPPPLFPHISSSPLHNPLDFLHPLGGRSLGSRKGKKKCRNPNSWAVNRLIRLNYRWGSSRFLQWNERRRFENLELCFYGHIENFNFICNWSRLSNFFSTAWKICFTYLPITGCTWYRTVPFMQYILCAFFWNL